MLQTAWDQWKGAFDAWEAATARHLEQWLRSPLVLGPAGTVLSAVMRTKVAVDHATSRWWAAIGLPTRRDQERMMHAVNQLQSRLMDLEERLQEALDRSQKADG